MQWQSALFFVTRAEGNTKTVIMLMVLMNNV